MSSLQNGQLPDEEKFWSLPDEIYRSLHQWPLILAFISLGALLGWGLTFILPVDYKAVQQVYVGLNPYRAFSDANFLAVARPAYSNIDDYKNWQMSQLETVIYLDEFTQATLDLLRQEDPFWQQVDRDQLAGMLDADWRTAGVWSLAAYHRNPVRAEQAALAWREVSVARVGQAVEAARLTFMVDQELQANTHASLQAQLRLELMDESRSALATWIENAQTYPVDQPLALVQRETILALGLYPAQFSPAWNTILENQPSQSALPEAYITWCQKIVKLIEFEAPLLGKRIAQLQLDHQEMEVRYAEQAKRSLGISPNLTFESLAEEPARPIRSTGVWILLGGLAGLITWGFSRLVIINQGRSAK